MPTLKDIKEKKKDLKDNQKLVAVKATEKGGKHMKAGETYHVGLLLADELEKSGRAKKV